MEITEKFFWEKYWGDIKLPKKVNLSFNNDKAIAEILDAYLPKTKNHCALEIGCAPGRWMIYLHERYGFKVYGYEYLDIAALKTEENLKICGIDSGAFAVLNDDFLTVEPEARYDLVLSLGFVEHFDNYENILQKHIDFARQNALIIVGFPNFRGINYYIQAYIDKIAGTDILQGHNIKMMNLTEIPLLSEKLGVEPIFGNYIGGFEPALFNVGEVKNFLLRLLIKILLKIIRLFFRTTKHPSISSYIIFVLKKV